MNAHITDIDRRLGALAQIGEVSALDAANALIRVDLGGPVTAWIPWMTLRAGGDRTWWAPEQGEQVLVIAPSGELANAVAIGSIYQNAHPQPAADANIHRAVYADGSSIEFNRSTSHLTVNVGSGQVTINCSQATINASDSITLNAPQTTCTGALTVQGMFTYTAGMAGSGGISGAAVIQGSIIQTDGIISSNGIVLDSHDHEAGVGSPV